MKAGHRRKSTEKGTRENARAEVVCLNKRGMEGRLIYKKVNI